MAKAVLYNKSIFFFAFMKILLSDGTKTFTKNSRETGNTRNRRFDVTIAQGKEMEKFLINGQGREWVLARVVEIDQVVFAPDEEQTHATTCRSNKVENRRELLTFNLNWARRASSLLIAIGYDEDDRLLVIFISLSFCDQISF